MGTRRGWGPPRPICTSPSLAHAFTVTTVHSHSPYADPDMKLAPTEQEAIQKKRKKRKIREDNGISTVLFALEEVCAIILHRMQHRNGVPHVTTLVFRIDSAPRGASILGIAVPAKAAAQTLSVTRRVSQTSQRRNGGDDDHYRAAREEEGACASTAVRFCTDSGTALTAHALHKMSHVHLDAELDGPPPPTHAHDTQHQPPPRQRVRLTLAVSLLLSPASPTPTPPFLKL
ncbi:hypothetical protein B0H16DRAFT_793777 [Mycena metata]|uniref:Uncharacterized protein n=1 Tax=Mycena metata TaxID=1033252 RepID=A0AAD7HU85_9AGAR|nr:hypothetical protein B0H16DRAFT_252528 [Mycena metata]KAJ7752287.1 hypothetical protein B0H16DRAFT_793777 [Mycena metata]